MLPLLISLLFYLCTQSTNVFRKNTWVTNNKSNLEKGAEKFKFLQMVDHFDPFDKRTFSQYYFVNSRYTLGRSIKNVILFIGGEYTLTSHHIFEGFITHLAEEHEALIVGLEHRHYGDSMLPGNYTHKDYATLTSQQALADLITFKWHMSEVFEHPEQVKWITYGGSYPGMLSSWARIKYPHLFYASIASSAPVEGKMQFDGYLKTASSAYAFSPVGGSKECALGIKEVFDKIDEIYLKSNNTSIYDSKLSACQSTKTFFERQNLIEQIVDVFGGIVQYNTPENSMNIKQVCNVMGKKGDPWKKIGEMINIFKEKFDFKCFDPKMEEYMSLLKSDKPSNEKSWFYQTCREFGFYSQCDKYNGCIFSSLVRSVSDTVRCPEIFDINDHLISGYIHFTNDFYGGKTPKGSRIIYVNGAIDPWNTRGVKKSDPKREQLSIIIEDGSHHQEFYEPFSHDSESLVKARNTIMETLKKWLE